MTKTATETRNQPSLFDRLPEEKASYDVVESKKKRRVAKVATANEDKALTGDERQKIKNTNLNQFRNFALVRWAVNKVLDFNTSFDFQATGPDQAFNAEVAQIIREQSTARRFDISHRMNRGQFTRSLYAETLTSGDVFGMKMAGGYLQGIEGDRIKTPWQGLPQGYNKTDFSHGIKYDKWGRAKTYIVCSRSGENLNYERMVPAANMLPMVQYTRFDQGRGVSPLTAAANMAQDLYEGMDAYAIKAKMVAWAGMVIKREAGTDNPFNPTQSTDSDGDTEYDIPTNGRPFTLDLDRGDELDIVESGTPPQEHIAHIDALSRFILLALDIPFTFYDQTKGSYTIQKDAWTQWEVASRKRREMVRNWLNRWTVWQLSLAIADRRLTLPRGQDLSSVYWEWQHTGRPWMDTKELQIDIDAIRMGLESAEDVIKRQGKDPQTIIDQNAAHYKRMQAAGVPTVDWDSEKTHISISEDRTTE